jgi:hypothetical protein
MLSFRDLFGSWCLSRSSLTEVSYSHWACQLANTGCRLFVEKLGAIGPSATNSVYPVTFCQSGLTNGW